MQRLQLQSDINGDEGWLVHKQGKNSSILCVLLVFHVFRRVGDLNENILKFWLFGDYFCES